MTARVHHSILRAFGTPAESPTPISTDNLANHKVGSGIGGPTRSKHFLRRYHSLKQRIRDGDAVLVHTSLTPRCLPTS